MKMARPRPTSAATFEGRLEMCAVRFEEVPDLLRLVRRAVEHGCRHHYGPRQRDAVYAGYASALFEEACGPFETWVARRRSGGPILGMAQLDPADGRLRALFVDAPFQHRGAGSALVSTVEARARSHGLPRLHGAMAANAVSFYLRAGFLPCGGPDRLMSRGISIPVQRMEKALARISRPTNATSGG